jgi:hypothetical protein
MSAAIKPESTILTESEFSKNIKLLSAKLPREDMQLLIYRQMERFLQQHKHKKVEEKCTEFLLLKRSICYHLMKYLPAHNGDLLNSLFDYVDITIASLFFKRSNQKSALHELCDKDFYFSFLNFAIDRVEFPSLIVEELKESLDQKSRKSIQLARRNYLSAVMSTAKQMHRSALEYLATNSNYLSETYLISLLQRNKKQYRKMCLRNFNRQTKNLQRKKKGSFYKLHRGYEIRGEEDVIVNRKIRVQDANKSVSFSTSKDIALWFAKARFNHTPEPGILSFADRYAVVRTVFDDVNQFGETTNRKCIVADFEFDEKDLVCFGSDYEHEVIVIPDIARLTRYSIVYST